MKNIEKEKNEVIARLKDASPEEQAIALKDYMDVLVKETNDRYAMENDQRILSNRGGKVLTSEETIFYNKLSDAIKSNNQISGAELTMPLTIIERVFDDLEKEHPLLSAIDFQNTTGRTEILIRKGDTPISWWGALTAKIKDELITGFDNIKCDALTLSAALPLCKSYLKLGAAWLDTFVRTFLMQALYEGLEEGIINGDGKDAPIGMKKNLKGSVVEGVYPDKTPVVVTDLAKQSFDLFAKLTNNGTRVVDGVIMVVNPEDYYTKVLAKYTVQNAAGDYVFKMPLPINFIQSSRMTKGKAVLGIGKKYFAGIGMDQQTDFSDDFKFLDNERMYLGIMHGNAKPIDNDSFIYISFDEITQ